MYEAAVEDLTRLWLPALAANAAVAFGATVQGAVGFGMALVAAPMLVLIRPELVPGPLLINGLALTLLVARRERDSIDLSGVKWALVGRVPGVALGALALTAVSADAMSLLVGLAVLAGVALGFARVKLSPDPRVLLGAGLLSGVFGTIASIGGPPLALVYQHEPGPRLRGTLAGLLHRGGADVARRPDLDRALRRGRGRLDAAAAAGHSDRVRRVEPPHGLGGRGTHAARRARHHDGGGRRRGAALARVS